MRFKVPLFLCFLGLAAAAIAADTGLVQMAQQDLVTLGYDPGVVDGQAGTKTIIAISKFQAEQDMEVTGEVTPQLIGALRAAIKQKDQPATAQAPAVASVQPQASPQALQQACLQEKYAAAQEANKKKRGFGRLLGAAARVSGRFGSSGFANDISRTANDVYSANATAADISAAAKDLGISEDEIEQCRNPS
jgi:peptidoglycan hydrolase-like protein with peptidoglycan-binding domain